MDIKSTVTDLIAKHGTNDPFKLAKLLGIQIVRAPLKTTLGYYHKYARIRTIILNQDIPDELEAFVCAHELGHAVCHTNINTQKLKMYTLFSTDKIEREANIFAVECCITDKLIREYDGYSLYEIAGMVGVPQKLADLKKFVH